MGFAVGETIGAYHITAFIGQGGMATIYKAHHLTLERDVALKVIHPVLKQDPAFVERLKREAAIIAKLNHPNIVAVYDFSEFEGTPYLALQFIDGKTLKDVLRDGKLATPQILDILKPVADALTYAHARGVLHRDVKPSNILIDPEGRAYLTDFGLARLAHSGESTLSANMLIGSPQYISPEQAKSENVDARTDVYGLGVVAYEMFTGRVPFSGDTPYATVIAQINNPPPAPRSINPAIPPAVEQVLLTALAKDPAQRYASIAEMIHALEQAAQGAHAENEKTKRKRAAWFPLALGLALLIALVCLIGGAFFAWQSIRPGLVAQPRSPTAHVATVTRSIRETPSVGLPSVPSPTRTPVAPTRESLAPRGKIAYSVATGDLPEQHSVWIADADGTDARQVIENANYPALAPDGKLMAFHRIKDEGIYVANLDGGNPRRVIAGETCCVQWSPDSKRLAFFLGKLKAGGTIFTMNLDGSNVAEMATGFNPDWSPDGNRIAYTSCQTGTTQCGLFVYDLKTKAAAMITRDNGSNPQWSPRGDRIVYQADDGKGHVNVFVANADGANVKQLTFGKSNDGQPTWSNDGNFIFWRSDQNGTSWAIWVMRADGSNPRALINHAPPDGNLWARESLSTGP